MLHDFQRQDDVEAFAARRQGLGAGAAVIDPQPGFGGVGPGHADIAFRRVSPQHAGAQPGHRLGHQAAAAADIQQPQARKRRIRRDVAAEMGGDPVADETQSHGIEFVQGAKLALRVPPFRCHGGKTLDFGGVDAGGGLAHDFPAKAWLETGIFPPGRLAWGGSQEY